MTSTLASASNSAAARILLSSNWPSPCVDKDISVTLKREKWALQPKDKDMVIMQHVFEYELNRKKKRKTSTLIMKGTDSQDTAMSQLVGLPLGIFVKLLMQGKISTTGVNIPIMPEIYEPVLAELESYGVKFTEVEE